MNATRPVDPAFNWHLSCAAISGETIRELETKFFFVRDQFTNNTHCEAAVYHGTFKGPSELMTREQWNSVTELLAADPKFEGDLEEEIILPYLITYFSQRGDDASAIAGIRKLTTELCPIGIYKSCDLHFKVNWEETTDSVKQALDNLEMISFDRPTEKPNRFNRIYTLTFESLQDGLAYFAHMREHLLQVKGLNARLKLEIATCFYRQPVQAVVLPIVRKGFGVNL